MAEIALMHRGLRGKRIPRTVRTLKKSLTHLCAWLDCTSLLLFSLTEDDLKSCCVANDSQIKTVVNK